MFRKFTKLYIVFLAGLIMIGGVSIFLSGKPGEEKLEKLEEQAAQKTPGYETMTSLAHIVEKQLGEDAVLDIQVSPNDKQEALLQLQSAESANENTLLEATCSILLDVQKLGSLDTITISWFMMQESENVEVLTLALTKEALDQVHMIPYSELPDIASVYEKRETLP